MTGLTKTTISSIINEFIALGIVEESSTISTGNVGKTPIPLHIRTDAVYTVGAHLGRESKNGINGCQNEYYLDRKGIIL